MKLVHNEVFVVVFFFVCFFHLSTKFKIMNIHFNNFVVGMCSWEVSFPPIHMMEKLKKYTFSYNIHL